MSMTEERIARSVALEKAYVHDVYEQFSDGPKGRPWPKVNQFLADLEPGSLVCDVGCGSGKYLGSNPSVFNIGADKCIRLTKLAKEKDNEVLICDNLALPFRDESFDAVLSVAVVHHFATTERRVCALRELARILRIGGRLIISVWAMEQTHRKFESQDVLVPWHRPQTISTPSLELTSTTNTSEEDVLPPYHAYTQTSDSDSNKSLRTKAVSRKRGRTRHKGRSIDPGRSSSPSSSSLSSPNETCYSFVRRAIQKLAGGKRSGSSHRPWFLDTWNSCTKDPVQKRYDPDGCENYDYGNIQDLPIELRRVDDDEPPQRRQTFPSSQIILGNELYSRIKSKSLMDIKIFEDNILVRSQSSVSSLQQESIEETTTNDSFPVEPKTVPNKSLNKPKLIKQKQSICDEDAEEALDKPTDMHNLVKTLPDFRIYQGINHHRGSVFKQRSMNEEIMSAERLREKESVKRNIQKQASLNDDLIYQRHTLDTLKDSFFSVSTSKRFQLIKSGFTNTIKNSTTNIEKVAGTSLKNGFVRMFQGWKSNEMVVSPTQQQQPEINVEQSTNVSSQASKQSAAVNGNKTDEKKDVVVTPGERKNSREDGSDSSKDSSLQSDTSVDSEDSFASVIFVPKTDPLSPTPLSPGPTSPRLSQSSVPNSPRVKQSSCPTSPRIKQIPLTIYPLTKQLSSPKPTTATTTTTAINKTNTTISTNSIQTITENKLSCRDQLEQEEEEEEVVDPVLNMKSRLSNNSLDNDDNKKTERKTNDNNLVKPSIKNETLAQKYSVVRIPKFKKSTTVTEVLVKNDTVVDTRIEDKKRSERLKQIRELLNQRPGFGIRSSRSAFPIVRHSSIRNGGRIEAVAKPLPRLLSLELFNPETDDKDSDSSGVSSPDSVDSVINIDVTETQEPKSENVRTENKTSPTKFPFPSTEKVINTLTKQEFHSKLNKIKSELSTSSMSLLEAAADVANSLDEAVDAVIQSSPRAKRHQLQLERNEVISVIERQYSRENNDKSSSSSSSPPPPPPPPTTDPNREDAEWNEECHKHLTDFADKLSEKLLLEIDQYQEESKKQEHKELQFNVSSFQHIDDPYIHRLSEELKDLNKLSAEIQKQNQYLSQLTKSDLVATNNLIKTSDSGTPQYEQFIKSTTNNQQCKCSEKFCSNNSKFRCEQVPYTCCSDCNNKDVLKPKNSDETNAVDRSIFLDSLTTHKFADDIESDALPVRTSYQRLSRETSDVSAKELLFGAQHSIESSDTVDISEQMTSSLGSDSQKDSNSIASRYSDGESTASLGSWNDAAACIALNNRGGCPSSTNDKQINDEVSSVNEQMFANSGSLNASLSDNTSQDSLPSDNIGGAITYHRYYHVFREGELDQLIERYVENLHIISSYYDHASWCVVAEKVQVWTI